MARATEICFSLFLHSANCAEALARVNAGSSNEARIAMTAMRAFEAFLCPNDPFLSEPLIGLSYGYNAQGMLDRTSEGYWGGTYLGLGGIFVSHPPNAGSHYQRQPESAIVAP